MNKSKITDFFSQISELQSEAEKLERQSFTRIILISILDTLSRCAHPNIRGNRLRFVALIDGYAQWSLSSTFSLRQLSLRLDEITNPSLYLGFSDLKQDIKSRMQSWPAPGEIIFPNDIDPTLSDLNKFLTQQLAKFIEPVRYPNLLWTLRNYAIHEGRSPGYGVDFDLGDPSPYYHSLIHADEITRTWELFFPNELLTYLLGRCVVNLKARFLRDDVDPWLAFPYKTKWF